MWVDEGGILPPKYFFNPESEGGLRNENFVIWMRTAAFPKFRKLFAKVVLRYKDTSDSTLISTQGDRILQGATNIGFKEGDEIVLRIIPNFPVTEFRGKKRLILSTFPPSHTNAEAIGRIYVAVGVVAFCLAGLVFAKLRIKPRKLGDPKYLHCKTH